MTKTPSAQVTHLIKMLNQIVNNNLHNDNVVEVSATHMKKFWALSMKKLIIEHTNQGGAGLEPAAKEAVVVLAEAYKE